MNYVIEPAEPECLPVLGTEAVFPVNNVFCVGRNYADHAIEMGGTGAGGCTMVLRARR